MDKLKKIVDSVSIIIPAYNEADRILPTLASLSKFCVKNFNSYEIVCVDDGSTDSQCGFKAFTEDAAVNIFTRLKTNGYAFDVEIFTIASALNLTVCDVPVTLSSHAGSKVRLSRDAFFMLKDLFVIALRAGG